MNVQTGNSIIYKYEVDIYRLNMWVCMCLEDVPLAERSFEDGFAVIHSEDALWGMCGR